MTHAAFALLERVHGHLALLGLAVLLHPVITLRTRRSVTWRMQLTADLAALLLAAPFALGWALYPTYRAQVKPALFHAVPAAALRFESKEHLAAMAVPLVLSGALVLRAAGRTPEGRRAAWALFAAAWVLGVGAGLLGLDVASTAQTLQLDW